MTLEGGETNRKNRSKNRANALNGVFKHYFIVSRLKSNKEKPASLIDLSSKRQRWEICLFHYK